MKTLTATSSLSAGYIDLNRVPAGVVTRPEQRPDCGYAEIQYPKARRRIIDEEPLLGLTGASSRAALQLLCRQQVEAALEQKLLALQSHWTESIAVGVRSISKRFRNAELKVLR